MLKNRALRELLKCLKNNRIIDRASKTQPRTLKDKSVVNNYWFKINKQYKFYCNSLWEQSDIKICLMK